MESHPEVIVEVDLRPNDVYTPFRWERGNIIRWVIAALLCLIFRDLYVSGADTLRTFPDSGSILAIIVVLMVFILLALLLFPYLRFRAMFRGTKQLSETQRITFRPDVILFRSESSSAECKWTLFTRIHETRKVFVFVHGSIGGTYVPKRCMPSSADVALLRQLIRENFKGSWTLRRD
jgi:hypothetical protein